MNLAPALFQALALIVVAVCAGGCGYLYGRWHATDRAIQTLDYLAGLATKPTAVLIEEHDPPDCPPALAPHVYRALPDPIAQGGGHERGLIVFLDDARRVLTDAETIAYAEGRADQADADDADPEQLDADDEPDLRECWSCTADRPATDDPCLYCQTPASRWTVGEKVTGHRAGSPGRHGQTGIVERVGYHNNGAPFYYVRWPDTSGRGSLAAGPYVQRELADLDSIRSEGQT